MRNDFPKQTVAQAFVLWRVPISMAISKEMLLKNIDKDIEDSAVKHGFRFADYSRRATPSRTLKFLLQRKILTEKNGLITRNKRTKRYVARLHEGVIELIDTLPICDPLTLLAGAGD